MIRENEKVTIVGNGPGGSMSVVDGATSACPLTSNLSRLRFPSSVVFFSNHLWGRVRDGEVTLGVDDLAMKLLQPILAWVAPSPGSLVTTGEHLFWVKTLGGMLSFTAPFDGQITRFNDRLYNEPRLPRESPYDNGWVLKMSTRGRLMVDEDLLIKPENVADWLHDEATRWEELLLDAAGLNGSDPTANADGGMMLTDPWVVLGTEGMQNLLSDYFNPL